MTPPDTPLQINQNLTDTVCLNCRNTVTLTPATDALVCPNCDYTYLVLDGLPILLRDHKPNLAAAYMQHQRLIEENTQQLGKAADAQGRQPDREILARAVDAYESDNGYLRKLQTAIERHVSKAEVDWCWKQRAEDEIATILNTVTDQVDAFANDVDTVLVPGAGAGRFACELATKYDNSYAFDYSVHMAQIFYDLLQSDLTLHRVHFRSNVVKTEDLVVKDNLSLDPPDSTRLRSQLEKGNLTYFVGDALNVPMPGNALSAIACIYFIDIVPLTEHLNEIRRMLKPGGLFINYGPLRYMRGDIANMLSGEEILALFRDSGFDILADDVVTNTQLASSPVITSTLSHSFMFVARKR
jgi:SAM-dependent methyltransferase/uncharacterized protein YbaR (Trm112 family)